MRRSRHQFHHRSHKVTPSPGRNFVKLIAPLTSKALVVFLVFLQTTSENERTRCTEILEPCSLCPYPLPRPFIRSLSVFIITLFFFPLSACAPHNEIPNRGRLHLPGASRWRLPLMERRPDAAARLPVRLWSDPRCSSPDGRGQLLSSPRSLFAVSFWDQIPAFSNLSLGKWGATSEKRRLCLLLMYNSRKGEKENKNGFYQLELTYFSRHLCFHILCLSIENLRRCPPPSPSPPQRWHFGSSAGMSRVMAIFGPF